MNIESLFTALNNRMVVTAYIERNRRHVFNLSAFLQTRRTALETPYMDSPYCIIVRYDLILFL